MRLIIFSVLVAAAAAAPMSQSSMSLKDDGTYVFLYDTGEDGGSHSRTEFRNRDGSVVGRYSFRDPTGQLREVHYKADDSGYVAKGDVGVVGAEKGQFPAVVEEAGADSPDNTVSEDTDRSETTADDDEDRHSGSEEEEQDNFQDLPLNENVGDGPPEAFPEGFFLHKFHGLRRLPEPKPATDEKQNDEGDSEPDGDQEKKPEGGDPAPTNVHVHQPPFHLRPFPGLSPQEWASAMFHQPVHVYSYQQPNAFGYHYFF